VFSGGPLVEAGGLTCKAGGTAIACGLPIVTKGTATAVVTTATNGSTSAVTVTLDGTNGAWDDYYAMVKCVGSGTRGTAGIKLQVSLDAGRTFGPVLSLGTATTLAIPNSGLTINFGAGDLKSGDHWRFSTTAPAWDVAGVAAGIVALASSQYGVAGWGSMHLVGVSSASDVANFQSDLEALVAQFLYERMITSAADALAPVVWGGSGETETAWVTRVATAFSAASAKRVCVAAGYYNMPSPYPNAYAGTPSYRRSIAWADAARRVKVATQRRGGAVSDGSLKTIVVDPASDPGDGFVYHDERNVQGLDAARFMTGITWPKRTGIFVCAENLMAPNGSQFTELVLGNVVDFASAIAYEIGVEEVSDDLLMTDAGTLDKIDALKLAGKINGALKSRMVDTKMVSSAACAVDTTANVGATRNILVAVTITTKLYVDSVTITFNVNVPV
jgi:hypothetical protein